MTDRTDTFADELARLGPVHEAYDDESPAARTRKGSRSSRIKDTDAPPRDWPFRLVAHGVEKRVEKTDKETGETDIEWRWFCSRLEVTADTRSAEGEEWGRLLTVTDRDGREKTWAMPMELLAGDGIDYRKALLGLGLTMAPGKFARDALHELISTARPPERARCVSRVGWHVASFCFNAEAVEARHG